MRPADDRRRTAHPYACYIGSVGTMFASKNAAAVSSQFAATQFHEYDDGVGP
jgi:hypothetical protein